MFRLFNDTDHDVTVVRQHRGNGEPNVPLIVPPGSPFEGSETSYTYGVSDEDKALVLEDRNEPMNHRILRYADKQREIELSRQPPPAFPVG